MARWPAKWVSLSIRIYVPLINTALLCSFLIVVAWLPGCLKRAISALIIPPSSCRSPYRLGSYGICRIGICCFDLDATYLKLNDEWTLRANMIHVKVCVLVLGQSHTREIIIHASWMSVMPIQPYRDQVHRRNNPGQIVGPYYRYSMHHHCNSKVLDLISLNAGLTGM